MRLSVSKKVFGGSITSSGRSWYGSLMLDMRCLVLSASAAVPDQSRSVVIRILIVEFGYAAARILHVRGGIANVGGTITRLYRRLASCLLALLRRRNGRE